MAALTPGVGLLERAVSNALGCSAAARYVEDPSAFAVGGRVTPEPHAIGQAARRRLSAWRPARGGQRLRGLSDFGLWHGDGGGFCP